MTPLAALLGFCLVAAVLMSVVVSALETALSIADAEDRRVLRQISPRAARQLEFVLARRSQAQLSLSLADSLLNIAVIAFCLGLLQAVAAAAGWETLRGWAAIAGALALIALLCEILPKLVALRAPATVLAYGTDILRWVVGLFQPAANTIEKIKRYAQNLISGTRTEEKPSILEQQAELIGLFEIAGDEGVIFPEEAAMMKEIVRLGQEAVSHCMTPRVDAFLLPDTLTNEEVLPLLRARRHRKVPVHGETPDEILGILDVERFLRTPALPYPEQLEAPSFIPETMNALDLLQNFLLGRRKIALLLDEYGGFEGLVTLSDILDELLGLEGPGIASGLYLEKVTDDRVIAGGHARLDDLHDVTGISFAGSDADTLGGFLMELTGGVPLAGTSLDFGGWKFEVRRASRKRVKEVWISRMHAPLEEASA